MNNLVKRLISLGLGIAFMVAAFALPLTASTAEGVPFGFNLPDGHPDHAEHDAAVPAYAEKTGSEDATRIIYDCGCSTGNMGTYTTNTNGGNVNIRSGHGTDTDVIGRIPYGSSFSVSAASSTWAHVNYNGINGYVSMSVIKKVSGSSNPSCGCSIANAGTYTTNTNGGNVNIRSGHGMEYGVIGSIPCGSSFSVSAASSAWAHVNYNGISGYASMSVIKKSPYTFSVKSYVDQGFLKRFSNAKAKVESYSNTVRLKLQAVFPVKVNVETVADYTSYCDDCKQLSFGHSNWSLQHLKATCQHNNSRHLESNPDWGTGITSRGFYFDYIRKNGVGTKKLTKVMWTGHIAYEQDGTLMRPHAVSYYNDGYTSKWHNIVIIPPSDVVNASGNYSNLSDAYVKNKYEYTLLHELSHTLGAPDHYLCWNDKCTCNSPATCGKSHDYCSNDGCWKCHRNLYVAAGGICVMNDCYDISTMELNKLYCPQCRAYIRDHLRDHH